MKKSLLCGLAISILLLCPAAQAKPLYDMSNQEIGQSLQTTCKEKKNIVSKIEFFSEMAKGTTYELGCLGEGPDGKYDKDPLVNFQKVDCMTFCEQILALSISCNYDDAFNNLQKMRYKDGKISMETRNHHTVADWLPNNSWLLHDATNEIGDKLCKDMTKDISHKKMFDAAGYKDIKNVVPDRTLTTQYIPKDKLAQVEDKIKSGDIGIFITNKPGIFASHMGIMIKSGNKTIFRNASMLDKKVVDMEYKELVNYLLTRESNAGMKFFRANKNFL